MDEHEDLRGSGHQSLIPYVHGRELYYYVCVALFKAKLKLSAPVVHLTFYSFKAGQLHCDLGPDRWP
jgi:hypothetical protein